MKQISLLGATGSIGTQTIDVVMAHPDQFNIAALAFGRNVQKGIEIIRQVQPKLVAVADETVKTAIEQVIPSSIEVLTGMEGLIAVSTYPDTSLVLNAILGSRGLLPTLEAIKTGKTIALANKETLVTAGHLVMDLAKRHGVDILPVDSEHAAIFQCLKNEPKKAVNRLIITASGGSFRDRTKSELVDVTVEEALKHPNWSMGAKITIDSATMMNKGLEVIEARWLFDVPYDQIDVVIHRESIVHSMVEFIDYSVIAELGLPDMRGPIQHALSYPERLEFHPPKRLNLWEIGALHFEAWDEERYGCLKLAYEAGRASGTMPTVLNAANEVAVDAFLKGKLAFLEIEEVVKAALDHHQVIQMPDLETIQSVDRETRDWTLAFINKMSV
ncbi:1-deoxy-D-xylulose-5-phosphate reductoisomerase [Pullulanibacillus sp. KACC 23026]|uniref:1-deoxy-D-xylulose-5-phosphate reductoisomerase n=1 Tax=Pullulanibacillus sp. KACC 23026 TaxID=3028315 RepID=UPI0023B121B0|nr:1-deoxy-D-xylulose-5-phosphate reductoisomerase [Pullulanibacillus sp. KACC 23026]WEG14993.1 1-deoxy-D-xylulose-5-phosphate reductoisomerase [Pullulanibacillus sp. KACC 23026]